MKRARVPSPMPLAMLAIASTIASAAGCDDNINKGWLIDKTRVLGAQVSAESDTTRASLSAGERGTVTWLVASPGAPPKLSWAYALCAPPEGNFASAHCEGPALGSGSGEGDGELVPMDMIVPPAEALVNAPVLLMLTAFCANGSTTLDPQAFTATCSGGGSAMLASTLIDVTALETNHNPVIADDAVSITGGAKLPPARGGIAGSPCTPSNEVIGVPPDTKPDVFYQFRAQDREEFPSSPDKFEALQLSTFTTSGEFDRQYAALDPNEGLPKDAKIEWDVGGAPAEGKLVRFYFVLRDNRGGMGFAVREACVHP
ncbi:hypothetical protein AKJ09_02723 [Labilithrix luteola]|uniref:Uncharacterized protein n=1 Tax=Labilithrix luteola TaxID=1391654 RepID=A0A0K1PSF4_9BACT|nr:hypothetical protein [Labilithrix luteola]AKU96059.1 hypothetical protein AKJ09_02723 [Labilithrix luteola]